MLILIVETPMNSLRIFVLLLMFSCFSLESEAQFWFLGQQGKSKDPLQKFHPYATMSVGLGSAHQFGEINPLSALPLTGLKSTRWNAAFHYTKQFRPHWSYRLSLSRLRLAGDDNYYDYSSSQFNAKFAANFERNLHVRTDVSEASLMGIFDFFAQSDDRKKRPVFSPYLGIGFSVFTFNPKARDTVTVSGTNISKSPWVELSQSGSPAGHTELSTYNAISYAIPLVIGFKYKLQPRLDLGFELNIRRTFTDYLDDVSDNRISNLASGNPFADRSFNNTYGGVRFIRPSVGALPIEAAAANTLMPLDPNYLGFVPSVPLVNSNGNDWFASFQLRLIFHFGSSQSQLDCPPTLR